MKKTIAAILLFGMLQACNNTKKGKSEPVEDNRIMLRADTLNVVHLADTLIIYESTCRGCAYEKSTEFNLQDSLGIVELDHIETYDNNPPDMDGGSISKRIIIVPKKTGMTTLKLYKFWERPATAKDSANYTPYTIEVKN